MIKESSRMGAYHALTCGENQDALCHGENRDFCVITLADGVSACKEARDGAIIASRAITNLFLKKGAYFLEFESDQIAEFAISHILSELGQQAEEASCPVEEYSSTVASVLVDKRKRQILCFNLGDSVIMAVGDGKCKVICMPSDSTSGCCVTTTKRAASMASVRRCGFGALESIVICSDGAWREMFAKTRLRPEVAQILSGGAYDDLEDYLNGQNCSDDYSFISMDISPKNRRKRA